MKKRNSSSKPLKIVPPTISSTLIRVMAYMSIILLVFVSFYKINAVSEGNASYSTTYSKYILSKDLGKSKPVTYYLKDNWIFVPNVTPVMVKGGAFTYDNYRDYPHVSNVSIENPIYGWNALGDNAIGHYDSEDIEFKTYELDGMEKYSAAYLTKILLPGNTSYICLNIPNVNGIARVFCNGKYVGEIGSRDLAKPFSFNDPTSNVLTLTPEDNNLELVIVVSCNTTIMNPGIISYPIVANQISSVRSIVATNAWLALIVGSVFVALFGCLIIQRTFSNKWKSVFFNLLTLSFLIFYVVDNRFIATSAIIRTNLRFTMLILCELWVYYFITSLFAKSKKLLESKLLLYDGIIPAVIGLTGIATINLHPHALGTLFPRYFILLYISVFSIFSLLKIFFIFIHEKNSGIAISFCFTSILCLTQMIDHEITKVNIPTYSVIFVISILFLELLFALKYVKYSIEVSNMQKYLETEIKEKTLYINEINRDLINKNKQLIDGEEARKSVLSNVSHDLRTPITAIRGYAELLLTGGEKISAEQKENYLTNILKRSNQMERIVSDIVELTRMESNVNEFQFTDISITELLDELVMMYQGDLSGTKKRLKLDISYDDMLIVRADPKKISRVFENLISNAINYTDDEAEITIKAWRTNKNMSIKDQRIHVTITDNGIGIPEDEIDKIFDRFYRAKNSGKNIKGTGLGLSIVKLICDKHDAQINIESKIGVGTEFHVTFKATN